MAATVGILGKLDDSIAQLHAHILRFKQEDQNALSRDQWAAAVDEMGNAYLWALGSYEVVRSLDEHYRVTAPDPAARALTKPVKQLFERVRMPLAKFERPERGPADQWDCIRVGWHHERGIVWQVSASENIAQAELSAAFLSMLEALTAAMPPAKLPLGTSG